MKVSEPESRQFDDFDKDDKGIPHGMFSGLCEFCQQPVKPFPTLEQQLKVSSSPVNIFLPFPKITF